MEPIAWLIVFIVWFVVWRPGMVLWWSQRREAVAFRKELENWEYSGERKR